jgi:diguanylate cyclase (GGDEF)-like protein
MSLHKFFSDYSLERRAALATVATLVAMLLMAGLALSAYFLRAQIEDSRITALTRANVASSTISAAMRFGGYDVIAESLRVFDTGPGHDSAAVYNQSGTLVSELIAPGELPFPKDMSGVPALAASLVNARAVEYPLRDETTEKSNARFGTLVVNPNQMALRASVASALTTVGVVLAIASLAGVFVAKRLSQALLRPVVELTAWAEDVAASRNLSAPAPRGGGLEVNRLTTSFETLIVQIAEQNRELKRKQYELKASNTHLETMAYSDSLTGLPNRPLFESTLQSAVDQANSSGKALAVLFIDLDNLKGINDQFGHTQGDAALRATAARIRRALRSTDFLARLAGDEFVVISPNVTGSADALRLGERLTVWLGIALPEDRWTAPVRASVGVAVFPDHGDDIASLVHAADMAMYRAKALPEDDSIRVVAATTTARTSLTRPTVSNVITLPAHGRKSQVGKP